LDAASITEGNLHSLDEPFVAQLLDCALPSFQLSSRSDRNLGFGYLYYGLTRALRPRRIVVVGSKGGFAPVCFAKGLLDNGGSRIAEIHCEEIALRDREGTGTLDFVDPSYSRERGDARHFHGVGAWDDPRATEDVWHRFGVGEIVTHHRTTSAEYLRGLDPAAEIDLVYVDGDHSYEGVMADLLGFLPHLASDSLVLAHDVDPRCHSAEGLRALGDLPSDHYEHMRLPMYPGLALLRPTRADVAVRSFHGSPTIGGEHGA
jgi:predicted O-methyltransferase YrrM